MKTAFAAACVGLLLFASAASARPPTRAGYEAIKLGMPQAIVERLLGPADEVKTSDDSTFLTWGDLFRSVNVQVVDGRVISKSHFGLLKEADATRLTLANYDRITTGMTQAEVEEILGPGDEASVSRGFVGIQWYAGTGTMNSRLITVGFVDGKVTAKSQRGLE